MNKEAVFALRFVLKDVAKMRKAMEQMNKNLAQMQKNARTSSKGIDKVSASFNKAARSALKFAAAYFTLSKIVGTVFQKAEESIQVRMLADAAGVAADKVGKLGKALRTYGGSAKSAGAAYASLTDIIGGAQHGLGVSEDIARVNAMYGIGFNYGMIGQDELMTNIAVSMKKLRAKGDQWGINQIASAYGLDTAMANFLADQGANWKSEVNAKKWTELNKSDTEKLLDEQDKLKETLTDLSLKIVPLLTGLLDGVNKIVAWIGEKVSTGSDKVTTKTDENGNTTYEVPVKTFGAFGKEEKIDFSLKKGDKHEFSRFVNPSFGNKAIENIKKVNTIIEKEKQEFEERKEKYESVPGQYYSRNWLTGQTTLTLDIEAVTKPNSGIQVNKVKYDKNVQLENRL